MPFDDWLTDPINVLPLVRETLGTISLDPASNQIAQEYVKAEDWYGLDIGKNGIDLPWCKNVFLNPPYSKDNIDMFVNKAIYEWHREHTGHGGQGINCIYPVQRMLILVNSSTDCAWYHRLLQECSAALLWRGRIKFWKIQDGKAWDKWISTTTGKLTNSPRYLSTFFYFDRQNPYRFCDAFDGKGTFIRTW